MKRSIGSILFFGAVVVLVISFQNCPKKAASDNGDPGQASEGVVFEMDSDTCSRSIVSDIHFTIKGAGPKPMICPKFDIDRKDPAKYPPNGHQISNCEEGSTAWHEHAEAQGLDGTWTYDEDEDLWDYSAACKDNPIFPAAQYRTVIIPTGGTYDDLVESDPFTVNP